MSLGKLVYFFVFVIFRIHCFLIFGTTVHCWCRNSIYENYFAFLRSDLDISVWIEDETKFLKIVDQIQKISSYYLIIKEMNFYLASAPLNYCQLINPLELKRDPLLERKLGKKISEFSREQRESYLLRMYFAEKNMEAFSLPSRSLKKWKYHLKRALFHKLELVPKTYKELFDLILKDFFNGRSDRFEKAALELQQNIPLHEIFERSEFKNELMTLFPEKFCFAINTLSFSPNEEDKKLIKEQIKWEVWAMMTQPWLFAKHSETTFQHLENLKKVCELTDSNDELSTQIESLIVYMQGLLSVAKPS